MVEYFSETQKIRPKIEKYLSGMVMDIGCGHDPVTPDAFGVDCRRFQHVRHQTTNLNKISQELPHLANAVDVVYSSHCLEHFQDDVGAMNDWACLLKPGGRLILYLPDDDHYDNDSNPEHLQRYKYESFITSFMPQFGNLKVLESGPDIGFDKYSFFVVAEKI